jgi:transcription elongation factor GreA
MTYDMTPDPRSAAQVARPPDGVILTSADFDDAVRELDLLRGAHRADVAERLRDARAFGTAVDDDDHVSVLEDTAVQRMKITQLERLVASATVVDAAVDVLGAAGLGSVVRIRDDGGKETEYELVGRRVGNAMRTQVTPASPVGEALLGSRVGDDVHVTLPNGRERILTVLAVTAADDA